MASTKKDAAAHQPAGLPGNRIITLDEFIIRSEKDFEYATGELTGLLRDIGVAAKIINREVNKAGLVNILGVADGAENTSGDMQQKLDVYANEKIIECLKNSGECCAIASEENDDIEQIPPVGSKQSKYVVMFDPLDGSSNIDVNVSVGTIFAIYRRQSDPSGPATLADFLQTGLKQVAAGYVLYGTSTILVYTPPAAASTASRSTPPSANFASATAICASRKAVCTTRSTKGTTPNSTSKCAAT